MSSELVGAAAEPGTPSVPAAATGAMLPNPALSRRLTGTLFLSQCLASMGFISGFTVYSIIIVDISGLRALAGIPNTLVVAGAALAAYPIGTLTEYAGRRSGLSLGLLIGMFGALIAAFSVVGRFFPGFALGLLLVGCARAASDQTRYAAAEVNPPERRGRALSLIVFGGTIGSVLGPVLISPPTRLARLFGIAELSGPVFLSSMLFATGAVVLALLLRPDPRDIGRQIAAAAQSTHAPEEPARSPALVLALPGARLAVVTMICAQAVMVTIMSMTSLHMVDYNHQLSDIALVISAHTFGMFGLSVLTGWLVDRAGARVMIVAGVAVIVTGALLAPLSNEVLPLAIALFLVGLGWNFGYVAGSAMLAGMLRSNERGRVQGATDLMINLSSAIGSLLSGVILAAIGYSGLCLIGAAVALLPLGLLSGLRQRRRFQHPE